jgi:transposase
MTTTVRKQYTEEFKREAVKLVTEKGYKVSEAARNLGVHVSLLRRWKERLEAEENGERPSADEREALSRLQAENRRLRMERETLRKATAFFAKESS